MTHPRESRPEPPLHPMEDEVELYEETHDVLGELDEDDLIEELADQGLAQELADFDQIEASRGDATDGDASNRAAQIP